MSQPNKTPQMIAEEICARADSVPWPITAFLVLHPNGFDAYQTFKEGPELERYRVTHYKQEIGTYKGGMSVRRVLADVLETYGEMHCAG